MTSSNHPIVDELLAIGFELYVNWINEFDCSERPAHPSVYQEDDSSHMLLIYELHYCQLLIECIDNTTGELSLWNISGEGDSVAVCYGPTVEQVVRFLAILKELNHV